MWCRHCQQDVPADLAHGGAPACPRCRRSLKAVDRAGSVAKPADHGLSLESFDGVAPAAKAELPTINRDADQWRRLERLLRPQVRMDSGHAAARSARWLEGPVAFHGDASAKIHTMASSPPLPSRSREARRAPSDSGLGLLLATGMGVFVVGVIALALSLSLAHAAAWRFGVAATISAQGLLIVGLLAIASRLWQNSWRLTRQLEGVDRQLDGIHAATAGHGENAVVETSGAVSRQFDFV